MKIRLGSPRIAGNGLCVLDTSDRFKHLYCVGSTRSGKTNFFLSLVENELDNALIVLDPVGTFANPVASIAPPERLVYIDKDNPISLNPLKKKRLSKSERVNEFIEVLNAIVHAGYSNVDITVLMADILRNAVRVIPDDNLEFEYLSEFLDREIVRNQYRDDRYFREFDAKDNKGWLVNREKVESAKRIAARLNVFTADEHLKRFITGDNELDIRDIVENKKIVCFNLHGFDDEITAFVGNLVSHSIKSYYLHEAKLDSPPLYFFVDEFHTFLTPFFNRMLVDAGKYNISINLSHHTHSQIKKELLDIVLGNCYAKVVLNSGYAEAERMGKEMQLRPKEILDLKPYEAYIQIGRKNYKVLTFKAKEVDPFIPHKKPFYNFLRIDEMSV